jgi:hypothetical protein
MDTVSVLSAKKNIKIMLTFYALYGIINTEIKRGAVKDERYMGQRNNSENGELP